MPDPPKSDPPRPPRKALYAALIVAVVLVAFLSEDLKLRSNLRSTTRITRNLREELETLRKERESIRQIEETELSKRNDLSARLNTLQQQGSLVSAREAELKKKVQDAETALQAQNLKVADLESRLKDAEEKMSRQKRASANLEQQTRSARANAGMTPDYVKLVENEWMAAVAKTDELNRDLHKTLSELSGQNQERSKLRNETATMHYNLAVILVDQQNYPAAITEYMKVLEIRPNDPDAHYNLAVLYDDYLKDNDKALEHYRQYVKAAPDAPEAQKVRRWIQEKEYDTTFKLKI